MAMCILLIKMIRYTGNVVNLRSPDCRDRAISNKNADGQPVDARQTKAYNLAPSRADVEV